MTLNLQGIKGDVGPTGSKGQKGELGEEGPQGFNVSFLYCLYSGKVWRGECLANLSIWQRQMNRSAKGLFIETTNLVWQITDDSPNLSNFPTIR